MSFDTTEANRQTAIFDDHDELWLFGYGSLIYKAGFDYIERAPATIEGWVRRYWQGSHDHRGPPRLDSVHRRHSARPEHRPG